MGLLLDMVVHPADSQDLDGAKLVISKSNRTLSASAFDLGSRGLWGETDRVGAEVRQDGPLKSSGVFGTVTSSRTLPRSWVVERTFAWLGRSSQVEQGLRGAA